MQDILRVLLAVSSITMIGCAQTHSTPNTSEPPHGVVGQTMKIWVDQDGTFYPDTWETDFPKPRTVRGHYSLGAMARDNTSDDENQRLGIAQAEKSVIAKYRSFLSDKRRLFILIHGFNNTESEANDAYEQIKNRLAFKKGDGFLELYWDGLAANGARAGTIWFKATGNSQLVGSRGLRKLLNATLGKEIVFITHSRGASVFLSALSDPPYRPSFVSDTERPTRGFEVYGEPKKLKQNKNEMSALILAPAIGPIDFRSPNYALPASMRQFDSQLVRVYHSVNPDDWVLKKFGASEYYNNTELGLKVTVAKEISAADARFKYKEWTPMKRHAFVHYVQNPQFIQMLKDMKIDVNESADRSSPD